MKEEADKQMDLMLRRWGSSVNQNGVHSENGDAGSTHEVHLDADELNAYAENALPATTRARYTDHLADCTRCRKMVSQLNQSAGLVFNEETSPQPGVGGLGNFISSFFSPMVLKYAIPALGIVLVAALGLTLLREKAGRELTETRSTRQDVAEKKQPAVSEPTTPETESGVVASRSGETKYDAQVKAGEKRAEENKKLEAGEVDAAKVVGAGKSAETEATDRIAEVQPAPVVNSEPPRAREAGAEKKTAPAESVDDARRGQAVAAAPASVTVEQQKELAKARDNEESGRRMSDLAAADSKSKNEVARKRATPGVMGGIARADKDEVETKSVGGHQFERRGALWVDVTYDSRATVNVTRGSDQYRALVADEPAIKTIADQLDGEVIVMWKNRAYRIR
jgi:hypothetical protein